MTDVVNYQNDFILENNVNIILFDINGFVQIFFSKFFNELLRVAGYNGKNLQKG